MLQVAIVGLGPIGVGCAWAVYEELDMALAALVDLNPALQGKSLAEITGHKAAAGEGQPPAIEGDLDAVLARGIDVAIVATSSQLERVAPTIRKLLAAGVAVVSSCEEMLWPWYRTPALADELHEAAVAAGRAVLATGVNPGFVMDYLPVVISSVVRRVHSVRCVRRVDASLRRKPLQAKVGAMMTPTEFRTLAAARKIGHAGIAESVALLAAGLGRTVKQGEVRETLEPVIAEAPVDCALGRIEVGMVSGMHNTASWEGQGLKIALDLTMEVGLTDPRDVITLEGPVAVTVKVPGGLHGDSATIATMLNHARAAATLPPGLRTMLDVPVAGCRGRD